MRWTSVAIAAGLGYAGFLWWQNRNRETWAQWPGEVAGAVGGIVEAIEGALSDMGFLKISKMRSVDRGLIGNGNVQAFLRVIRSKESSQGPEAYRMIVGKKFFTSFADHPRIKGVCWSTPGGQLCSTAAGAYQITATTWDETKAAMGLPDFSPASQDLAALGRIAARGALPDVLAGRVEDAIKKLALEWEAFKRWPEPEPYKQVFMAYGGAQNGYVVV